MASKETMMATSKETMMATSKKITMATSKETITIESLLQFHPNSNYSTKSLLMCPKSSTQKKLSILKAMMNL